MQYLVALYLYLIILHSTWANLWGKKDGKEKEKEGGKESLKGGGKEVIKEGGKESVKGGGKEVTKEKEEKKESTSIRYKVYKAMGKVDEDHGEWLKAFDFISVGYEFDEQKDMARCETVRKGKECDKKTGDEFLACQAKMAILVGELIRIKDMKNKNCHHESVWLHKGIAHGRNQCILSCGTIGQTFFMLNDYVKCEVET